MNSKKTMDYFIKIAILTQNSSSCILRKYFSLKARNFWEVLIVAKSKRPMIQEKLSFTQKRQW